MEVDPDVLEILKAVAAPLDPADIKIRKDKDKDLRYIDARVVINRLNAVCPGLWSTYVQEVKQGNDGRYYATGTLTICGITHGDCGMSETDKYFDPPKAAVSDLLKRCAVRFGFGIELYSDEDQRPVGGDEGYSKPKPKQQPAAKPTPYDARLDAIKAEADATKMQRPWVPVRLEQQLLLKISKSKLAGPSSKEQQGMCAGAINALFDQEAEPDKWRHSFILAILKKGTIKDLTKAEASVLIEWAQKDQETAALEAYLVINRALEEAGQLHLPG